MSFAQQVIAAIPKPKASRSVGASRNWYDIASSSDGAKLVAVGDSINIYTSTDNGTNWTSRDSARVWRCVASSSDGVKLVAGVYGGQIYTSTDSGVNWTARDSSRNWNAVDSSSDGTKLVASVSGGQLYVSTDSGATWTAKDSNRSWTGVACSADGTKQYATADNLYYSTDSGATWAVRSVADTWTGVSCSDDGAYLVCGMTTLYQKIIVSTTSGVSIGPYGVNSAYVAFECSGNATAMYATDSATTYESTNYGLNWTAMAGQTGRRAFAAYAGGMASCGNGFINIYD